MDKSFVSIVAHVKSSLFGMAGTGTKVAFVFGRTDGACAAPPCGGTTESQLWVAGLVDGLDTISLASDIFGPSPDKPPIMERPVAVFDQSRSRIIVAGGGESGKFGVWAYTPHIGRWHEFATPLPPDLQGVAMVADRARHRLYLLGGRSGGEDLASLVVVNLLSGAAEAVTPPPSALARSYHAMAIDPFNRFLYVFGGSYGAGLLGDTWQYDLRTRVWTQVGDGTNPNGPGPRERAQMLFERRHGRLWVSGGWDAAGYVGPTLWGYSTAMNVWTHRTLAPERGPEGETRQGVFAPDAPVAWSMTVDEKIPYPGQPYRLVLGSDDPCVGLLVSDEVGQPIARSRHCAAGDRAVAFFGQPGERYLIELVALQGFELGQTSDYQLELHEASLRRTGELVLPGTPIPKSVAGAGSSSGPVAFVLAGEELVSVDLTSPEKPEVITSLGIEGGVPRDLLVSHDHALVSVDSGEKSDSIQRFATSDPWEMKWLDSTDLPNDTGGLVALWRGRLAYLANGSEVDIVDLAAPDGPKYVRTLKLEDYVTCLRIHGDRLYLCTLDKRLTVYGLDWQGGEQKEQELDLTLIGQSVRVHGNTMHVGELGKEEYQSCISGGLCNTKGVVEVFQRGEAGFVWMAEYPLDEGALPYLIFTGSAALRINAGGFDVYDLEPLY